ncbi:hypothetical protein F5Y16DRAFT_139030 [Xylariaceae sp. FL0255]|nr:hypothetical protein F5Y16DRAFT_139030 [Xylariaceae sp. FL0255]
MMNRPSKQCLTMMTMEDQRKPKTILRFPSHTLTLRGHRTLELGAGAALPSIMASLLGARDVTVTDFPSDAVLSTLRRNIEANCSDMKLSPCGSLAPTVVAGHAWGDFDDNGDDRGLAKTHRGAFDRIFVCDCLWMPWQHYNLQRSIAHFLARPPPGPMDSSRNGPRAWVIGAFHTGRAQMRGFFDRENLAQHDLEVERIWERDCDSIERDWIEDRGVEDVTARKRWLVIGILRWKRDVS